MNVMLKFGLVFITFLFLAAAPFSTGTVIQLTRESALAGIPFTPLSPQAGTEIDAATSTDDGLLLDARVADIPFVIVPPSTAKTAQAKKPVVLGPDSPTSISFPSLGEVNHVERVGVNSRNEMDVPSGSTTNVGWYKDGTVPGDQGSAVIDAHVFAAFNKLRYLKIGSDIYVAMASGKKLHFTVIDSRVYTLSEVPLEYLFNRDDGKYLNLITCAGHLTPDKTTYDHRLIVYAKLVE